jgi:hypothetical protein
MKERPPSYFWAHRALDSPHYGQLSEHGYEGLEYAEQLADDARYRVGELLSGRRGIPPLSFAELARQHRKRPATIERRVAQARHELFGTRSDNGIRHLIKRRRELQQRRPRACAAPGCSRTLPNQATKRKKHCSGNCRVRAHRALKRDANR